jgi:hypothetical protein
VKLPRLDSPKQIVDEDDETSSRLSGSFNFQLAR